MKKQENRNGKILTGKVASTSMQQSVVVTVERQVRHKMYGKIMRRSSRHQAHVEDDMKLKIGDSVKIQEVKPRSKNKHFIVLEKVEN